MIPGWEPGESGDEPLSTEELYSILVREPFNLRLHEIAALDRYQIYHVYLRPRDKDGCLVRSAFMMPSQSFTSVPFSKMFRDVLKRQGKTDAEVAAAIAAQPSLVEAIQKGDA